MDYDEASSGRKPYGQEIYVRKPQRGKKVIGVSSHCVQIGKQVIGVSGHCV
jgi:hypothetical protein